MDVDVVTFDSELVTFGCLYSVKLLLTTGLDFPETMADGEAVLLLLPLFLQLEAVAKNDNFRVTRFRLLTSGLFSPV